MTVTYPNIRIKADSQHFISTGGYNDITGGEAISDKDGALLTSTNASCFVTVTDVGTTTSFSRTTMTYDSNGLWTYTLPSATFLTNHGPWTIKVEVFDQTGTAGTLLRTFYATAKETD